MNPWDAIPQAMRDRMAADDIREQRAWELEAAERAERAWERQQQAERNERMTQYLTGHSSQELHMAQAMSRAAREARRPDAEVGSVGRAAIFTADGELVNDPARRVRRGPQDRGSLDTLLARAQNVDPDGYMAGQVRQLRARQQREAGSRRPVVSRSAAGDAPKCLDCIEQGATPEESFLLHNDPDRPLPVRAVPDYPPRRARRLPGTGWPVISR